MNRIRILVIMDSYPPNHSGGYEIRCRDICEYLSSKGHNIQIITTKNLQKEKLINFKDNKKYIFRILNKKAEKKNIFQQISNDFFDLLFIKINIIVFKPTLIYLSHTINLTRTIFPFISEINIPIVYDEGGKGLLWAWKFHGIWYSFIESKSHKQIKTTIKNAIAKLINIVSLGLIKENWKWPDISAFFNNIDSYENIRDSQVSLVNSKIILSGVDTFKFNYRVKECINSPLVLISPGRITKQKGIIDSIKLLHMLIEEGIHSRLYVVGKFTDGVYVDEVDNYINKNNLSDFIEKIPFVEQEELIHLYHKSDICFFPSYQKIGLSRIPLEAMACGCIVITYGNEGSRHVIKNNETGFIVPEGDLNSVVELISDLIKKDTYKKVIENARLEIENNYDITDYFSKVENFILSVNDSYRNR